MTKKIIKCNLEMTEPFFAICLAIFCIILCWLFCSAWQRSNLPKLNPRTDNDYVCKIKVPERLISAIFFAGSQNEMVCFFQKLLHMTLNLPF